MSVSVSPYNPVQQAGCRAKNPPDLVIASRAPNSLDYGYFLGTLWLYQGDSLWTLVSRVISPTTKSASWVELGGVSGAISAVNGTTNQVTVTTAGNVATVSLPAAITAPGSLATTTTLASGTTLAAGTSMTAGTTITSTLGDITATNGNFVSSASGKGLVLNSPTASGAASGPVVVNGRSGAAVFTSVSIAAAADLTLTITNSAITGSSTQVVYFLSGVTTGAALSVKSVTNSAGSSAVVVTNGTGATTSTSDITLTFLVLN